ncbi:hypothetical protein CEXT_568941 [Caerostris extrusa]|uniref:Uncharacterized protein n=1 Tax=Caerostris extrusa TaxID=172846 RepID=A0AAV4RMS6_CAEEX|nr:hypothetical protein CEXT_568941 [Caerostris extrusa]
MELSCEEYMIFLSFDIKGSVSNTQYFENRTCSENIVTYDIQISTRPLLLCNNYLTPEINYRSFRRKFPTGLRRKSLSKVIGRFAEPPPRVQDGNPKSCCR